MSGAEVNQLLDLSSGNHSRWYCQNFLWMASTSSLSIIVCPGDTTSEYHTGLPACGNSGRLPTSIYTVVPSASARVSAGLTWHSSRSRLSSSSRFTFGYEYRLVTSIINEYRRHDLSRCRRKHVP